MIGYDQDLHDKTPFFLPEWQFSAFYYSACEKDCKLPVSDLQTATRPVFPGFLPYWARIFPPHMTRKAATSIPKAATIIC
jgi:hypothetical protein